MEEIKFKCDCGNEVENVYEPLDSFEYAGCDEENYPTFKCKVCAVVVYG